MGMGTGMNTGMNQPQRVQAGQPPAQPQPPAAIPSAMMASPFGLGGRIPGNYAPQAAPPQNPMQVSVPPNPSNGGFPPPTPVAMNRDPPMAMTARALRGVNRY